MKRSHVYEASDGTKFVTASECKQYEYTGSFNRLRDLTMDQIQAALARTDLELANAFERAGNIIAAKRREMGELKRRRPAKAAFENADKAMKSAAK